MSLAWRRVAIALFTLCLLLGGVFGHRLLAVTDEAREALRVYTELISLAHDEYGAEVKYETLVTASINGMLRTLDPHSNFLPPEPYSDMRERQQESFHGLGILVGMRNGRLTVITPIEGTPASRLGIRAGDFISMIEEEPTEGMTLNDAVHKLKGPKGTQVTISIVRPGLDEPLRLTITRDEIPQKSVRHSYMLDELTGYIALTDFNRGTGQQLAAAIEQLRAAGMQRLLLDLRFNGGGLLDQAIEVADQFLPKESRIVETRGRTRASFDQYDSAGKYPAIDLPVVTLVNEATASAAEIVAGAIQDHDIGLIVGTSTWGKGLVQTVYSLRYGNGLALTTARYFTPSGRLIQRDYSSWYDYQSRANVPDPSNGNGDGSEAPPLDESRQVFATTLGRDVFGGGGITPDVVIEPTEIAPLLQRLQSYGAFFDFSVQYANQSPVESENWKPGSDVRKQFENWLTEKEYFTAPELEDAFNDPSTLEYALRQIRAEVMNSSFGFEARSKVLAEGDEQIREALRQFDRARDLMAQRQSLGDGNGIELQVEPRG